MRLPRQSGLLRGSQVDRKSNLRFFLHTHLEREFSYLFGVTDDRWIDTVTDDWLNDETNSQGRYSDIVHFLVGGIPQSARILDMACGCGTFVYYGLRHGLDVWGIDPEDWKHTFNRIKAEIYDYPSNWKDRFIKGVGEGMPFPNQSFDLISSYQTIEHVQDVRKCLREMLRVLRPGGMIFLRAPDYSLSTFEGHYRLPWLPMFPRALARLYLRVLGRPLSGLAAINYVASSPVKRMLSDYDVKIVEPDVLHARRAIRDRFPATQFIGGWMLLFLWRLRRFAVTLFRKELNINLIIVKAA